MRTCAHPLCTARQKQRFCGRHYAALSDELRRELRFARSSIERDAVVEAAIGWFESERMIGEHEISRCRGQDCGADIVWLRRTDNPDKRIPVNADEVSAEDGYFDPQKHKPHRASCPNAADFQRPTTPQFGRRHP